MKNIKIYEEYSYGAEEIGKIPTDSNSDIWLENDPSGENLRGENVTVLEYAKRMLRDAVSSQDWGKVHRTITYLEIKGK